MDKTPYKDYSLISDIFIYLYHCFVPSGNRTRTSHSTGRAHLIKPSVTVFANGRTRTAGLSPPAGTALPTELHQHMVEPVGLEPTTYCLQGSRSLQLEL